MDAKQFVLGIVQWSHIKKHDAFLFFNCRSTYSVWVRHCGSSRGRLCPNRSETGLHGGQSAATQVCRHQSNHRFTKVIFNVLQIFLHLISSKGTHHLWSIPISSFQDITYHFRVSLSVSYLPYRYGNNGGLSQCSWLWLMLVFVCSSFTERCELYQQWRLLVILRIPFPHWEQLFVRHGTSSPSPTFSLCGCFSWRDYCTLFFRDIHTKPHRFHISVCFH